MERKDILREVFILSLIFIIMGLWNTIVAGWGNLSHLDTWLQVKYYDEGNLAICLALSRTLYLYLPTKLNKWLYPIVVVVIWAVLISLLMFVLSKFSLLKLLVLIFLGLLLAIFHKPLSKWRAPIVIE